MVDGDETQRHARGERTTGVILAAGAGARLGPLGARTPKACLRVAHRPLLHHQLDLLASLGIDDVYVVVGHEAEQVVVAAESYPTPARVRFVEQPERRGIASALALVRGRAREHLVVVLGDTYFLPARLTSAFDVFDRARTGKLGAVLSVRTASADAIRRECTVLFDDHGHLQQIIEKPITPLSTLKPCGFYFFRDVIFDAIARTAPSPLRGEVELTDAIGELAAMGFHVGRAHTVRWDMNVNFPQDLLAMNLVELRRLQARSLVAPGALVDPTARISEVLVGEGAHIEAGAVVERTLVLPGARVSADTTVRDCVVGPTFTVSDCLRGVEWPEEVRPE